MLHNFSNFSLLQNGAIFIIAAAIVWWAGTRLTGYLDALASRTGINHAFVGMLALGGLTSLPEIAVVGTSSLTGNAALATNNLLGSVAINVVLIAVADAILGRDALSSVVPSVATVLYGTFGIIGLALVAAAITVGDAPVFGIGMWPIVIVVFGISAFWMSYTYVGHTAWRVARMHGQGDRQSDRPQEKQDPSSRTTTTLLFLMGVAAAGILIAGYVLSRSADAIANQSGIGSGLIGLVLVGFATSLPELSSVTEAVRRKRYEMALGNIFGTNLLTLALIALADLLYPGDAILNLAGRFETIAALLGLVLTAIFLIGLLERANRTVLRMGYDAIAAIATFAAGLVLLYLIQA